MSAGDGWTASTSGTISLGGGSVSAGTVSLSNGMLTLSVGKTAHAAGAAVSTVFGMDRALNANAGDTQLQATMALGGATIQGDNEMDGDNLETTNQTVGIKGSYGTMSYGLGWQADGDLGDARPLAQCLLDGPGAQRAVQPADPGANAPAARYTGRFLAPDVWSGTGRYCDGHHNVPHQIDRHPKARRAAAHGGAPVRVLRWTTQS